MLLFNKLNIQNYAPDIDRTPPLFHNIPTTCGQEEQILVITRLLTYVVQATEAVKLLPIINESLAPTQTKLALPPRIPEQLL